MDPDKCLSNQYNDAIIEDVAARKKKTGWGGKRPGAGRKPELQDPVSFTLDFEEPQFEALKEIAEDREVSVASLVREAVRGYLARRRRG